jgi:hypothetical protein
LGAAPSSFTVPVMLAAVAGSMGVAAGAEDAAGGAGCSAAGSLLPQPARTSPSNAGKQKSFIQVFVFIFLCYLS